MRKKIILTSMTFAIWAFIILAFNGCSTESFTDNTMERGKGKNKKAIVFAPTLDMNQNRTPGNTALTVPIDYPEGSTYDFNSREAELNGVTYSIVNEIWNGVVVTNTLIVSSDNSLTLDVDARYIRTVNINGVDTVVFVDDQGVKDLSGNLLYASDLYFGVYYQAPSLVVTDLDDDGTDDLLLGVSGGDNHKVTVVHDFLGNATETVALYEITDTFRILDVIEEAGSKFVVFKGGAVDCATNTYSNYSISEVLTTTPPVSYSAYIESMEIVSVPNGNATATLLEFTQLPSCERFLVTVTGLNGEYIGYGVGQVKNVDASGEGYFSLIRYESDGDNPASYDIAPGNYWVVFPGLPSTADPNEPVKVLLTIP